MELTSKAALVTGGAVRIGREICRALGGKGCRVVIHCRDSRSHANELREALGGAGVAAFVVEGDLSSQKGCDDVLARAYDVTGGLHVLVNNAGVFHKAPLLDTSEESLEAELRINLFAPILLSRSFAARLFLEDQGVGAHGEDAIRGKIVNLLDQRVAGNETGCLSYLLSKKALGDFTRNAAVELAPLVTVNAVAPGAALPPPGSRGADTESAGRKLLGKGCMPADVARAVIFLLESDSITGQTLFVDAGQHLLSEE